MNGLDPLRSLVPIAPPGDEIEQFGLDLITRGVPITFSHMLASALNT